MVQHPGRQVMRPGEMCVLLMLVVCVGGVFVTALKPGLVPAMITGEPDAGDSDTAIPQNPLDLLSNGCSALIYGNLPRQSFSGDTTILTMDLDIAAYTVTQANLTITRLFRNCDITLVETRERPGGGLTFKAILPGGLPLRVELKAPM